MTGQAMQDPEAGTPIGLQDVVQVYALVLARSAEPAAAEQFLGCEMAFLLGVFFEGPEFADAVLKPLNEGRPPIGGWYADRPSADLLDWAGRALDLSPNGAAAVRESTTWPMMIHRLFCDPVFHARHRFAGQLFSPIAWASLEDMAQRPERYSRAASIDAVGAATVTGWAVSPLAPDRAVSLELWHEGVFLGAGTTSRFRREIQDRFGGEGRVGFSIHAPALASIGPGSARIQLRDASTGLVMAEADPPQTAPTRDALADLRRQLTEIRTALERVEAALPALVTGAGHSLEDYPAYHAFQYAGSDPAPARSGEAVLTVRLDCRAAPPAIVEDAVMGVLAQTGPGAVVRLEGLDAEGRLHLDDLRTRLLARGGEGGHATLYDDRSPAQSTSDDDIVLLMPATTRLAPGALEAFVEAFDDPAVAAVYSDEDSLVDDEDLGVVTHVSPQLKGGFDEDLLHQRPYVGRVVAFRQGVLQALALRDEAGPWRAADALLRLEPRHGRVGHVARVLHGSTGADPATDWLDRVSRHFAGDAAVSVEPHRDRLGAAVDEAVRVRRNVPPGLSARVVIPTRDALDLLEPCVDSLLAARASNATRLDLQIIDHQSQSPDTLAWLDRLQTSGDGRVTPYSGTFNWALMNNLAVADSEADVLVFLNNDTVVITPDWLDELCAQAMRPEVGVVGARLVYADATLQHAGFVARDRPGDFLIHDGVGAAGSDAGYLGRHALLHRSVAVTGACLAIRREVFRALGGFDAAHFPVEGSDVDLCLRAQAEGLRVLYDPYATLYHLESKTRGFSRDGDKLAISQAAARLVWTRWGEAFADHDYNPHFDRSAAPFTRLRPLP